MKISPHQQDVKDIIRKVISMRGSNPMSSNLQSLSENVNKQMLAQNIRNKYIHDTVDQVQSFSDYNPTILKWLFDEHQESKEDEHETQRDAIKDFEKRKLDYKYF